MGNFSLPEHMIAWSEQQVALGRAASIGTYVAQLIAEDRKRQEQATLLQSAIAEARASGISMQRADSFLARFQVERSVPAHERLRSAIREGRDSGYSRASLDGILARALMSQVAAAA
jgi:Arc/MetJ-type ribon-helix-helix transcriptional regulator